MKTQIKISDSRTVLLINSDPYVIFGRMGYTPVIDVEEIHKGTKGYLVITAVSLGEPLNQIQVENSGKLKGVTIAIQKENSSKFSPYIVERLD
jgi:hypothetical protein